MRFRLVPKSSTLDDPERPWTAKTHFGAEKMRLLEPTAQIWMKIDPYMHVMQRQKCRPMTLVSGNIRHMRILAGIPLGGDFKWEWGCWRRQFLAIWVATSSETLEIRPALLFYRPMTICYPLLACDWLQSEWPIAILIHNDLEWLFHVKLCFRTSSLRFRRFDFEA